MKGAMVVACGTESGTLYTTAGCINMVVVAAISSSRGSEKLKFDEIRDVVLSESIRKREVGDSSGSDLSVDRRGRSKTKGQN